MTILQTRSRNACVVPDITHVAAFPPLFAAFPSSAAHTVTVSVHAIFRFSALSIRFTSHHSSWISLGYQISKTPGKRKDKTMCVICRIMFVMYICNTWGIIAKTNLFFGQPLKSNQPTNWLTDRPTYWLTDLIIDWLTNWLTNQVTVWSTDWLADRPTNGLTIHLTDWPSDWPTDILTNQPTD